MNKWAEPIRWGKMEYTIPPRVFKLSRFGRNAADALSALQVMQDFGGNLICVEDGIDSSKDVGKLMISILSAVAEIERENIRVQTMEGRIQKAREGKWNGGFAPYGCKHRAMTHGHKCDFKKQINEELLDGAVAEVIVKLVSNPKFAAMMQEKISMTLPLSRRSQRMKSSFVGAAP